MKIDDTRPERLVDPSMLSQLIEKADRVIVRESPWINSKILFESKDMADLVALKQSLIVEKPTEWFHCRCDGTPAIYIYSSDGEVVQVTNHHGLSIRCSLWDSDARIIDTEKWLSWFDERGIDEPRKEVDEIRTLREQHRKDWKKWTSAMPEGLQPVWEGSLGQSGSVDTAPLRDALNKSIPRKEDRIRALLTWFGSGAGAWSGFPSYESAAEELLLDYETDEIVDVLEKSKLTSEQTEGAVRFFSRWTFSKKHPKGIESVPEDLANILMQHVKNTKDKDKLRRVKRAFKAIGITRIL